MPYNLTVQYRTGTRPSRRMRSGFDQLSTNTIYLRNKTLLMEAINELAQSPSVRMEIVSTNFRVNVPKMIGVIVDDYGETIGTIRVTRVREVLASPIATVSIIEEEDY